MLKNLRSRNKMGNHSSLLIFKNKNLGRVWITDTIMLRSWGLAWTISNLPTLLNKHPRTNLNRGLSKAKSKLHPNPNTEHLNNANTWLPNSSSDLNNKLLVCYRKLDWKGNNKTMNLCYYSLKAMQLVGTCLKQVPNLVGLCAGSSCAHR